MPTYALNKNNDEGNKNTLKGQLNIIITEMLKNILLLSDILLQGILMPTWNRRNG